jgi:hypothetical protein
MKLSMNLMGFCLVVFAPAAGAYEYPLQFTPNHGYRGLVVAGYSFNQAGTEVIGNCSYYTVSGGGGSQSAAIRNYSQTCTWDLFGNLLTITPGAPVAPAPLSVNGTQVVYARNANGDFTGTDTMLREHGFVNAPGAHYTWLTPQHNAVVLPQAYTLTVTLLSDGDIPLAITAVAPSALLAGVSLVSTTCIGETLAGKTCTITVQYDATHVTSASGQTNDTLRIELTSDAGGSRDFIQNFTVILCGQSGK